MLYTYALVPLCSPLLIASIVVLILVISHTGIISGQLQAQTIGVNITSPERGKTIPVNSSLTVSGKSTDNPFDEICQVSVIVNSVRPYQPATANGSIGQASDYSKWFFILSPNYTSIKEGINEITARLSCLPSITTGNNLTKWYSVNVTGVTVDQNATAAATTTPTITTSLPPQTLIPNQEQGQLAQPPSQLQPPTTLTPTPQGLPIDNLPIQESMQGGNEPDIIEGTLFADNIDGENGDDRVQGSSGDDTITGGNGDDYLQGDEGNDNLRGVNGDDMLFGGSGDDALDGGNGADNFSCGSGTDTILDFSSFQDDVKSADCEIS